MKIAFIVQPDWLYSHFGVRNLFISCFKILQNYEHDVEFVCFGQHTNKVLFYKNIVKDEDLKSIVKNTSIATKPNYDDLVSKPKIIPEIYTQFIGTSIKDDYDAFIITNPWLLNYPLDFGNKPVALICHDCGANSLVLRNNIYMPSGIGWGFEHNTGYQYAQKHNFHFLSNSKKTDQEVIDFYAPEKHSYLPPVPPYSFLDIVYDTKQKKENAIVLAAPFDPRKGLALMPEVLNALNNDFDTLYIFGTPRCGKQKFDEFYKKIKVKNIVYYDTITSDDLITLYKKCKILFFPSIEEGLGIPLIEAQLCGCRVVTTNDVPMNQLICLGGYLLKNDSDADIENIRKMLKDKHFDYQELSSVAKKKFSVKKIYLSLINALFQGQ